MPNKMEYNRNTKGQFKERTDWWTVLRMAWGGMTFILLFFQLFVK